MSSSDSQSAQPARSGKATIFVPTRNRSALVERALRSALAQEDEDFEVVVVDDGSTDDTAMVLARLAESDDRLRSLRLESSRGASAARNHAIRHARGRFVVALDDDDSLAPDHLTGLRGAWREGLGLVASSRVEILGEREVPNRLDAGPIELEDLLHYNRVGPQLMAERDSVLAIGGYDEDLPAFQDYDLAVRLVAQHGPALKTRRTSYRYHVDPDLPRISSSDERRLEALGMFVQKHRELMSPANLRSMELLRRKLEGGRFGLGDLLHFSQRGNRKAALSLFVNTNLPGLQRAYHAWKARHG